MSISKPVELDHTIDFQAGAENDTPFRSIAHKVSRSYGPFSLGSYTATIKIYPNGNKTHGFGSVYVKLSPKQGNLSNDNDQQMVHVTLSTYGLNNKSFSAPLSTFIGGYGIHELFVDLRSKQNMRIKIKMNQYEYNDVQQEEATTANQAELLYKLSKVNGDITLIISNNDVEIGTQPPLKRRRLNKNKNHNNDSDVKDNEEGTDIEEKNQMRVTGVILQAASTVFNAMLSADMIEKKKKTIEIKAESIEDIDNMYYCIVTNKLRKNANAKNILILADLYQIDTLKYKCAKRLLKDVKVDNCIEIINVFDRYAIKEGYNTLIRFAKTNINKLTKKNNFKELSHSLKMTLLS